MATSKPDYISSDCAIAARHIEQGMGKENTAQKLHPLTLLRFAYEGRMYTVSGQETGAPVSTDNEKSD
jgi:hypothetical protein